MKWNSPLSQAELVTFRQCVIAALPSTQQAELAKQLKNILLTDKRVKYLILAIKHSQFTEIATTLKQWHDEDIEECVTPELLAHDWLTAKNTQPRLWRLIAWLRYPSDLAEQKEPTIVGIRLHDIWEQRSIKYRSRVRAWLFDISLKDISIKKSVSLDQS